MAARFPKGCEVCFEIEAEFKGLTEFVRTIETTVVAVRRGWPAREGPAAVEHAVPGFAAKAVDLADCDKSGVQAAPAFVIGIKRNISALFFMNNGCFGSPAAVVPRHHGSRPCRILEAAS